MACRRQWTAGAKARQAGRRKDENAHPETMDCPERKRVRPGAARMKMDCRRQWAAGAKARQAGRRKDENGLPETMDSRSESASGRAPQG